MSARRSTRTYDPQLPRKPASLRPGRIPPSTIIIKPPSKVRSLTPIRRLYRRESVWRGQMMYPEYHSSDAFYPLSYADYSVLPLQSSELLRRIGYNQE
jgi:hypothetical protein